MARATKNTALDGSSDKKSARIDETDKKIIASLLAGMSNKEISKTLQIPLSTVQRRTRNVLENDFVKRRLEPNYRLLGYSKGLLHVYINGVDAMAVASKLAKLRGVIRISLHIGNSDVVADIIYKDNRDILSAITETKKIDGISRVLWSEEVLEVQLSKEGANVAGYFRED